MEKYSSVSANFDSEINNFVEDCSLFAVFDAPVNVIFIDNFKRNIKNYKDIFAHFNMRNNIFFSCKSNKSLALLKTAANAGCGIEVSSYYELIDALKYTNKIIASGPGKDEKYIECAIKNNCIISIDDVFELKRIISYSKKVKVFLRISDLLNIVSRFGICLNQLDDCLNMISNSKLILEGFSFHINNYDLDSRVEAIKQIMTLINKKNISVKYVDIGGGIPTNYCSKENYTNFINTNTREMYFNNKKITEFYRYYSDIADENALKYILDNVINLLGNVQIIIEPGRCLLKDCGISIYKIEYLKEINKNNIIVTNGNINCLSEQWFNSDYLIEPKLYKKNKEQKLNNPMYCSIAGNLCLEQDMITWRKIKFEYLPENGDYLIYYNTAGYQMDSNESEFHKIPLVPKKIVVKKNRKYIVRNDEDYDC